MQIWGQIWSNVVYNISSWNDNVGFIAPAVWEASMWNQRCKLTQGEKHSRPLISVYASLS